MSSKNLPKKSESGFIRIASLCIGLIAVSQLLMGGCGGGSSEDAYFPKKSKPKATVEAVLPVLEGSTANMFIVSLSKQSGKDVSIVYSVGGTATVGDTVPPADHDLADGVIIIPAGDTTASITVTAENDDTEEGDETIVITLVSGTGCSVGDPAVATGTIVDEDVPNTLPTTNDDAYQIDQGAVLNVSASGVLENDTDVDLDPLTAVLVDDVPVLHALTLYGDGSFDYTPPAEFYGEVTFTYVAKDLDGESETAATVTITVSRVNTVPVAVDDDYSVGKDATLNIAAAGVLDNDSDADSYPNADLEAFIQSSPESGDVMLNADGSLTYTPSAGFFGSDSFTYMAYDGESYSNVATVTITVNSSPVATNETYFLSHKTSNIPAPGLLLNATDADGDPLTAILVDAPAIGVVTLNPDGSFQYKAPEAGVPAPDSFTYKVNDGLADSNVATVLINPGP